MPYVTRNGIRRTRPRGSTNGIQYSIALEGTCATFACKAGHRMTKDYSKGPINRRLSAGILRQFATYWGLGLNRNGTRGHCYGWCQRCQNEADGVAVRRKEGS